MKKLISVILAVVIALTFAVGSFAAGRYGDVTGDNKVNSSDALKILYVSTGFHSLPSNLKSYADLDGNGKINAADALYILQYGVGLIDIFPVEKGEAPDVDHDIFG